MRIIIDCWASMQQETSPHNEVIKMGILIASFWLSGIIILSSFFTLPDQLETLTIWMFLSISLGSLFGGIFADCLGRKPVFHICTILLLIGSFLMLINPYLGYVVSAVAIGPLNNLTFVIILEGLQGHKDFYTTLVLIGWASSQICLGLFFLFEINPKHLFLIVFVSALLLTISTFLFISETQRQNNRVKLNFYNIIPSEIKPLAAGCILMFTMQMFYYRTQFTLDKFGISAPLNTIIVGCTEILANLLLSKYLSKIPRKRSLQILFLVLIALFLLLLLFQSKLFQTIVEGVMRIFDTGIMLILGVYIPQLFSIKQRARGTNFVMSFGVIGSAFSQFILNNLPFYFLTFFLIIAEASTCFLRETLGKYEKQDQKQSENFILMQNSQG